MSRKFIFSIIFAASVFLLLIYLLLDTGKRRVEITVNTGIENKVDDIFIAGSEEYLGNWDAGSVKLSRINDSTHRILFETQQGKEIQFKFTRGKWENEACLEDNTIPQNYSIIINADTSLEFHICCWKNDEQKIFPATITGEIRHLKDFSFGKLAPRDVLVWLPPGYEEDTSRAYPVLYMHDAQNAFNEATSTFGIEWAIDESLDSLIRAGIVQPIIVVGIYNSSARREEYGDGEKGREYMENVVNILKPYIDKNFQTRQESNYTLTGGASQGGLIAFRLYWEFPSVFGGALCAAPSIKVAGIDYLSYVKNSHRKGEKGKLYFSLGGRGIDQLLKDGTLKLIHELKNRGYRAGHDFQYYYNSEDDHGEAVWARTFPAAIKFLLEDLK